MLSELAIITRVCTGTGLGFLLGFERGVRGSPAGDRTFSLVGASAAAVTAAFYQGTPQAIAGVLTGVGFIGGGVVLRGKGTLIRGVTTAATVFATAAIGMLAGIGAPWAAVALAALLLMVLEVRYIPVLRWLDSQRYLGGFVLDAEYRPDDNPSPPGPAPGSSDLV